jgi:3-methyl-2-oxobutanoate hydroxymethyltransferase
VRNAQRFIQEAGCDAVKLEWFDRCLEVASAIVKAKIPVMGHVGLTPQTVEKLGGFKVQGRDVASARRIIQYAKDLERAGCFSVVLECIPEQIAQMIFKQLKIPTIGIGAGVHCDGQVLVIHDVLGLTDRFHPKFVKTYVRLGEKITNGINAFVRDVRRRQFPYRDHSYRMDPEEFRKLGND